MGSCNSTKTKPITVVNNLQSNQKANSPNPDSNQLHSNNPNCAMQANPLPKINNNQAQSIQIDKKKKDTNQEKTLQKASTPENNIKDTPNSKKNNQQMTDSYLPTQPEVLLNNPYLGYNHEGECITLSFGDSFDTFDSFFTTITHEHSLDATPQHNYNKFFTEETSDLKARGIAIDIPESQFKILNESPIQTRYHQANFKVKPFSTNESFASAYFDNQQARELAEILRKEAEKCSSVSQLHLLGNIFSGYSMGLCSTLLLEISSEYTSALKIAHLKYVDTFTYKAFSKIKNYIYGITTICDNVQMVNLFNTPLFGDVLSSLTIGDRISQYSDFNLNRITGSLLINQKANSIYSNGIELRQERLADCANFLYEDCKEGKSHVSLSLQNSSLTIYKGMQLVDELKFFFKKKLNQLQNKKLKKRHCYFGLFEVRQDFGKEFAANFHQSNYFKEYTEEYILSFIQKYNLEHFSKEEMELRETCIEKVNDMMNNYKEIWKLMS